MIWLVEYKFNSKIAKDWKVFGSRYYMSEKAAICAMRVEKGKLLNQSKLFRPKAYIPKGGE